MARSDAPGGAGERETSRAIARRLCRADDPGAYPLKDDLLAMNFVTGLLPGCGWSTSRITDPQTGNIAQAGLDLYELIVRALRSADHADPAPELLRSLRAPMWQFVPPDVARVAEAAAAEIERLRAEVAELRYQLNRETNPRRNQ